MRIVWLALLLAACSAAPNTQRLPIGSHCGSDGDCGTTPFACTFLDAPGGYCSRPCTTDGDCPLDAACIASTCRRKCAETSECRATEGYVCRGENGTSPVCDTALDGGSPSG